jgi:hypothetical protein
MLGLPCILSFTQGTRQNVRFARCSRGSYATFTDNKLYSATLMTSCGCGEVAMTTLTFPNLSPGLLVEKIRLIRY